MNAKNWLLAVVVAGAMAAGAGLAWGATVSGTSAAITVWTPDDTNGSVMLGYPPFQIGNSDEAGWWLDGKVLFSSLGEADFIWQSHTLGEHVLECRINGVALTSKTVNVTSLAFMVPQGPNPPTAADANLSITPETRSFGTAGGGGAIAVSGSGTWAASASDSWITLKAASGQAGYPVAYTVEAATDVEPRTGYVYVSGHVHTVSQEGAGATISPASATFETTGGAGTIEVTAPEQKTWQAKPNVEWLSVVPTSGTGAGSARYSVAPWNEVNTRQGTLTVGGQTFTVFQYGRRIKISPRKAEYDYLTHVISIAVDALAITEWTVAPQDSWISVVDGGRGQGGDTVSVAIGENPSWKTRTGTVKIGTETFTVTQQGRTALEFDVNPKASAANVEGANGVIAVSATPDLPWSAESQANWLTIYAATANGAGNGNVVYAASPNPTLYDRTGTIAVTPGDAKAGGAQTHSVTQPAAASALSLDGCEFAAAGENREVRVSVADIVQWQIQNSNWWLKVVGETNRVGPATVTLQAEPNGTVYSRNGTVTLARKTFRVAQLGRNVEVSHEAKLFGAEGGDGTILIHPDGNVSWTAVSSDPTWITIWGGNYGTGEGEILFVVSPYVGDAAARTGTITVGDKVVYITQRPYDLSISPNGSKVEGNNGAGEFGVSASTGDVWTAIATEPWITLVEGCDTGTGNGTVRFAYTENDTGKTRTGKIIVAGEVYTLEQQSRQLVAVTAEAGHGGTVSGGGTYELGTKATLTATAGDGYAFARWTGDVSSTKNPLAVTADAPKLVTAEFKAKPVAFGKVSSVLDGVSLAWNNLGWALTYRLLRGTTGDAGAAELLAEIPNTGECEWVDKTGDTGVEYWYWVEAVGSQDNVRSDPATGKKTWEWPAATNADDVTAALAGAADARLAEHLKTVAEYEAFLSWMADKGLDAWAVKTSPHVWPSYQLGAEGLFGEEPTIHIDGVAVGRDGAAKVAENGAAMEVRVTVRDGGQAVSVDAGKIAGMFEATGDLRDWGGDDKLFVTVRQMAGDGAVMQFQVVPGDGIASGAFLRLAP